MAFILGGTFKISDTREPIGIKFLPPKMNAISVKFALY